ncbi:MAG: antitoxin [Gammaproteobacteria bacterium]|nr:antitoxin [Gammaproteobacteria bacterium]
MRTTLDIADDVLQAARERARREHSSIGGVISALARQALTAAAAAPAVHEPKAVYGLRPIGSRGGVVTNESINRLRDDDAY